MNITTYGDANAALGQLSNDITATATAVGNVMGMSDATLSAVDGSTEVGTTSLSLLNQLAGTVVKIWPQFQTGDASTPLVADQIAQLKEIQQEVISDRSLINQSISSVNWTFGGIFDDAITESENLASQAVTGITSGIGSSLGININWTIVAIVIGLLVLLYFRKVFA